MTLNELIKGATKVAQRYTSGDIPLWYQGQEVDVELRDVVINGETRVVMEIRHKPVELPETRLRREILICADQKPAIDELVKQGIVERAAFEFPSCDVEVLLSDHHTHGKTGDWLVLDEQYFWRIMSGELHRQLAEQGKIIII